MTQIDLTTLDDRTLLERTTSLVRQERETMTEVLRHLAEVERRKLYASKGYSSLFDYCVRGLRYSEPAAQRRITSMRLLREMPEVEVKLQCGALTLSHLAQVQQHFKQEARANHALKRKEKLEVIRAIEGSTARDAERVLLSLSSCPQATPKERIRTLNAGQTELRIVLPPETMSDLERVRGLLAHRHPDVNFSQLITLIARLAVAKLDPSKTPNLPRGSKAGPKQDAKPSALCSVPTEKSEKIKVAGSPKAGKIDRTPEGSPLPTSKVNRRIPAQIRREVYRRDGSQCTYKDPTSGLTCRSHYALEIDHIIPHSMGGPNTMENLRLLCRNHNRRCAILQFGSHKVPSRIRHEATTPGSSGPDDNRAV